MFTTKTITKFLKSSLKRQLLLLFQDDKKEYKNLISIFRLKSRCLFLILPTKLIN